MRWSRPCGARKVKGNLIHHSDKGSQYLSIRYAERLAEIGIAASVGSTGDAYDNAMAETINGLYKAEVIWRQGPWKSREEVERATLSWVHWFNTRRLLAPIGNIPPAEFEKAYYAGLGSLPVAAEHTIIWAPANPGRFTSCWTSWLFSTPPQGKTKTTTKPNHKVATKGGKTFVGLRAGLRGCSLLLRKERPRRPRNPNHKVATKGENLRGPSCWTSWLFSTPPQGKTKTTTKLNHKVATKGGKPSCLVVKFFLRPQLVSLREAPQEGLGPLVLGRAYELPRRPLLDDEAAVHEDRPVRHVAGEGHLVGHDDHRHPLGRQGSYDLEYLAGELRIEGARGLVEEEDLGIEG